MEFAPRKRVPRLTDKARRLVLAALLVALCLGGLLAATGAKAQVGDERYTPSARNGREIVREMAEEHFAPEWVGWVVRTAGCESSFNLYAYSAGFDRRWGVWYEHIGALQVDGVTWRRVTDGDILEPAVNFAVAAYVLAQQGRGAWPWCGR